MPLLALAAPVITWRRRVAQRRRGETVLVGWQRRHLGEFACLVCDIDVPAGRVGEIVEALASLVAEGCATVGHTVGCVGIVAEEEPILVALAPRRDVIAARVRGALTAGESHRCPQLWLTLPAGHYLAAAVNPNLPFVVAEAALLGLLADGRARHALLTEVDAGSVSSRIVLALYTPRSEVRKFFTLARNVLEELSDLRAAR